MCLLKLDSRYFRIQVEFCMDLYHPNRHGDLAHVFWQVFKGSRSLFIHIHFEDQI